MTWAKGDALWVKYEDREVEGIIALASPNNVSLFISFEALLGKHAGAMPILLHEDGVYRSIIDDAPVYLRKRDEPPAE